MESDDRPINSLDNWISVAFTPSLERVLGHEGGLADDPDDPGGLTNRGITIGAFEASVEAKKFDIYKYHYNIYSDLETVLRNLTLESTKDWYTSYYRSRFENWQFIPKFLFPVFFDTVVNMGHRRAVRFFQAAYNRDAPVLAWLSEDGYIGSKTIKVFGTLNLETDSSLNAERKFLNRYLFHRNAKYIRIIFDNNKLIKFGSNWQSRAESYRYG